MLKNWEEFLKLQFLNISHNFYLGAEEKIVITLFNISCLDDTDFIKKHSLGKSKKPKLFFIPLLLWKFLISLSFAVGSVHGI